MFGAASDAVTAALGQLLTQIVGGVKDLDEGRFSRKLVCFTTKRRPSLSHFPSCFPRFTRRPHANDDATSRWFVTRRLRHSNS